MTYPWHKIEPRLPWELTPEENQRARELRGIAMRKFFDSRRSKVRAWIGQQVYYLALRIWPWIDQA